MVEFLGMLKVRIVRGINLAVRDLLSSDPYVVATLGGQVLYVSPFQKLFCSYSHLLQISNFKRAGSCEFCSLNEYVVLLSYQRESSVTFLCFRIVHLRIFLGPAVC